MGLMMMMVMLVGLAILLIILGFGLMCSLFMLILVDSLADGTGCILSILSRLIFCLIGFTSVGSQ